MTTNILKVGSVPSILLQVYRSTGLYCYEAVGGKQVMGIPRRSNKVNLTKNSFAVISILFSVIYYYYFFPFYHLRSRSAP